MTYTFHPEARLEFLSSAEYYEQRGSGLGASFLLAVETAIGQILEAPTRWPIFEGDVRRCLTHVFPYGILYTMEHDHILILAVMHCSRRPGYWKDRLT